MPASATMNGATSVSPGPKRRKEKKSLDPSQVTSMITSRISQLEVKDSEAKEEEENIQQAIKQANTDLRALVSSHDDHLDRVEAIQARYMDLFHDMKRLEMEHAKAKKRSEALQKERDVAKSDLHKANAVRTKLEALARELQRENKRVAEEGRRLAQNEQKKREELSYKFENTIGEIKVRMEAEEARRDLLNPQSSTSGPDLMDDDLLKEKVKSFLEQYEIREHHFAQVLKTKELETQLYQAKYHQQIRAAEVDAQKTMALRAQVQQFTQTESELRSQLNVYVDKFKQVEETLNKSNDLFLTFRREMEQMTKKTKKLEKENDTIKAKCEGMNANIIVMAEERTKNQRTLEASKKKIAKLENLCRALQSERNALKQRLEEEEEEEYDEDEDEYEEEQSYDENETTDDEAFQGSAPQAHANSHEPPRSIQAAST